MDKLKDCCIYPNTREATQEAEGHYPAVLHKESKKLSEYLPNLLQKLMTYCLSCLILKLEAEGLKYELKTPLI